MTRSWPYVIIGAATFSSLVGVMAWLALHGFMSRENIDLTGYAIATLDGVTTLRDFLLTFPSLPYLLSLLTLSLTHASVVPAPTLACAFVLAILTCAWLQGLIQAGYLWPTAMGLVALLICNPVFISEVTRGLSAVILALACWFVATLAFRLRARGTVVDLLGYSFGLAILALSHPLGILLSLSLAAFTIVFLGPQDNKYSNFGAHLTVLFPLLLVLSGAIYVSWLFTGDPRYLFHGLSLELDELTIEHVQLPFESLLHLNGLTTIPLHLVLVLVNAPILIFGPWILRRRLPRLLPLLALAICVPLASAMSLAFEIPPQPLLSVAALLGFAAASLTILPIDQNRSLLAAGLSICGLAGGLLTFTLLPDPENRAWLSALQGQEQVQDEPADLTLGRALIGRTDVLIDTRAAPALLAGRRSAKGLLTPHDPKFEFVRMTKTLDTQFVAVRYADIGRRDGDAVHEIFPHLYKDGMAGYALVYDQSGWRVYQKNR